MECKYCGTHMESQGADKVDGLLVTIHVCKKADWGRGSEAQFCRHLPNKWK